mgnify:CR=1 FL=1
MTFNIKKYQVIKNAVPYELANFIYNYFMLKRDAVKWMYENNIVFDKGHLYTLCKYNQTAIVKYIFSEPHRIYHMTRYIATEGINHSWISERNNKHPINAIRYKPVNALSYDPKLSYTNPATIGPIVVPMFIIIPDMPNRVAKAD